MAEQARHAAVRLLAVGSPGDDARLTRACRLALGREPTDGERRVALDFLRGRDPQEAWAMLFHSLFASADFRYVD